MEQLQEEVPEVREEEEEEEEAVMVASGASDPSGGPESSLPSSSYTGEWSHGTSSVPGACRHLCPLGSMWSRKDLPMNGVWLVLISSLCEITHREPGYGEAYFFLRGHCTGVGSGLGDGN